MNKELKLRIKTSIILLICLYLMINFQFILGYVLIVVSLLSIFELDNILSRILKKRNLLKFFSNIFFILYMLIFCTVIFIFTLHTSLKLVIFYFLFICIFSDIGGLLFGKLLKGPKLISISPKKTISGSIGSFTLPFVFSTITFYSFNINFFFKEILILTFLISLASQIGDIFFSYLKRKAKLKDTGKILPGHGGILDRIDGLLLGIPVGLFYLYLIN